MPTSIPRDFREMAQTLRDMTQTIRVHIKQILERHEQFAMKATRLVRQSTN
jgi:methyl-accepting chemotaxis protein